MENGFQESGCRDLWKEAFGDSDEFIETFMKNIYSRENMLYIEKERSIISMLHIIPFTFNCHKAGYIYAVATTPKERGKGLASMLLERAIDVSQKKGFAALFTIPANEELRTFYSKFGFTGRHPIEFITKENFDFGTGDKNKDIASVLFFNNCAIDNNCGIILKM